MGIIAKTGERVIVIDPRSGTPFALMNLEEYEKMVNYTPLEPPPAPMAPAVFKATAPLTPNKVESIIDPELAIIKGMQTRPPTDGWGGDENDEDRYYMEPAD